MLKEGDSVEWLDWYWFEFSYRVNQGEKLYVSDACHGCIRNLMQRDAELC